MIQSRPGTRLSVLVDQNLRHGHHTVYAEIVQRARKAGLAGATVLQATEGFGSSGQVHCQGVLSLSRNAPVVVVIVDSTERIEAFLGEMYVLISHGLVVCQTVDFVGRGPGRGP